MSTQNNTTATTSVYLKYLLLLNTDEKTDSGHFGVSSKHFCLKSFKKYFLGHYDDEKMSFDEFGRYSFEHFRNDFSRNDPNINIKPTGSFSFSSNQKFKDTQLKRLTRYHLKTSGTLVETKKRQLL